MTYFARSIAAASLGGVLATFSMQSAFAQDANAVAQRLKETFAAQGIDLNFSGVSGSGSQVVLDGVTYGAAGMPAPFNIGKVTLDGVTEANGGYKVATISFPAFSFTQDGLSASASESSMSNVTIPPAGSTDYLASMLIYESAKIDRMEMKLGEKQVLLIENTHAEMSPLVDGKFTFAGAADKLTADLTAIPDLNTQAVAAALGYQTITGNVQLGGSWNTVDGRMELSKYDILVDNAGKLGMTIDIGGYTPDFIKAMQDITKQGAPGGDQTAQNVAMMGLMQQLLFNGASLRFEDASLTDKVLAFMAKQQGAEPAQLKDQTKTIVPFLLASSPIKDEALKKQIAAAVGTYMDSPKSITIRAKPAVPQPFSALAIQGQADPGQLTQTLGVTVTAND